MARSVRRVRVPGAAVLAGLAALLALTLAFPAWGADSGGYRGPRRDGVHPETDLLARWPEGGPKLLWRYPRTEKDIWNEDVALGAGWSNVCVAGDGVYATGMPYDDGEKNLYAFAFDLEGELKWRRKLTKGLPCGRFEGPRATPEVVGGRLYVTSGTGEIFCLDPATGETVWRCDTRATLKNKVPGWGYNSSPLVVDDRLIVPVRRGTHTMAALDLETGSLVWGSEPSQFAIADNSPVLVKLGKRRAALMNLWSAIVAVDVDSGEIAWRLAGKHQTSMTAVAHGGRVLLAVGGRLRVWRPKRDGSGFDELHDLGGFDALCQVVVLDGRVYAVSGIRTETTDARGRTRTQRRPALAAWDLDSGDLVAKLPLPMTPRSLVAADGKVYLVESDNTAPGNGKGLYREKGRLSLIRPTKDGMETVGAFQPAVGTKEIYTCPVVAAGRLFHRHGTLLAVYDLRRTAPGG